jgi:hypothetical protein
MTDVREYHQITPRLGDKEDIRWLTAEITRVLTHLADTIYDLKSRVVDEESASTTLSRPFTNYIDINKQTIPIAPTADSLRLYVEAIKGFSFYSFIDDTGMVRKIVRDSVFVAKNATASSIPALRAVYATGSSEGVPTIGKARANSLTTMPAIGVTVEAIAPGSFGRVMQVGLVENANTSSFTAGDVLYVSSTVAGVVVKTAPLYPNIRQEVGVILVSDATEGAVQVIARSMFNEGILDHGGLLGLTDNDHPQYLQGAGTTAVLRQSTLLIEDGTLANRIKCTLSSRWNGDADGPTDNIVKGATTGNYTLNAGGTILTIEAAALSGNCLMAHGHASIVENVYTEQTMDVYATANDIRLLFYNSGVVQDITGVVTPGNVVQVNILYLTDA